MNAYKQFNSSDIVTTPFVVNKAFSFSGSNNFTASNVGIDVFIGTEQTQSLFNPNSSATTGYISTQYKDLVFSSIRQLYYSNYYSQSFGDNVGKATIIPNNFYITESVNALEGLVETGAEVDPFIEQAGNIQFNITGPSRTTNYYNYLSNTLTASRTLNNVNANGLGVIAIPSNLFGEYIKPGSFKSTVTKNGFEFICIDDGLGNIFTNDNSGYKQAGNIIYEHGLIIYTLNRFISGSIPATSLGPSTYVTNPNLKIEFSSSITLYETQFNCRLRESEFLSTNNPSAISGSSSGTPYPFITDSFFKPYITTVGLYNERYELLAVGKLAQPLPKSDVVDTNIIINLDMY